MTAVINKAPLTIKALDRRAYVGERMPAFAYDVVGLLGSDTLDKAPSFSCNANMNMPGTYVIRIFGAEAANYDISYVNGILTVEHRFVIPGYKITVVVVGKGEASASAGWADAGSVISVISKADEGYTLGSITVETESGRSVAMKDGKFTMPASDVAVTGTWTLDEADYDTNSVTYNFVSGTAGETLPEAIEQMTPEGSEAAYKSEVQLPVLEET